MKAKFLAYFLLICILSVVQARKSICRLPDSDKFATCVEKLSECEWFKPIEEMITKKLLSANVAEAVYSKYQTCTDDDKPNFYCCPDLQVERPPSECRHEFDFFASCVPEKDCNVKTRTQFERILKSSTVFPQALENYIKKDEKEKKGEFEEKKCPKSNLLCCPHYKIIKRKKIPSRLLVDELDSLKDHEKFSLLEEQCKQYTTDRIIGGKEAGLFEFPWMVLLVYSSETGSKELSCGGTLITDQYVLTAAHCIKRNLVGVRLGEHNITAENGEECEFDDDDEEKCLDPYQEIDINRSIKHPQYSKGFNDIALIELKNPANLKANNVKTICLPLLHKNQINQLDETARKNMIISGWGITENNTQSDVLMKAFVPYVNVTHCKETLKVRNVALDIEECNFCAGGASEKHKIDTCHGDSGGPIQAFGPVGETGQATSMIQYGIVSGGIDCKNPSMIYPGVYTDITLYLNWILDNITVK